MLITEKAVSNYSSEDSELFKHEQDTSGTCNNVDSNSDQTLNLSKGDQKVADNKNDNSLATAVNIKQEVTDAPILSLSSKPFANVAPNRSDAAQVDDAKDIHSPSHHLQYPSGTAFGIADKLKQHHQHTYGVTDVAKDLQHYNSPIHGGLSRHDKIDFRPPAFTLSRDFLGGTGNPAGRSLPEMELQPPPSAPSSLLHLQSTYLLNYLHAIQQSSSASPGLYSSLSAAGVGGMQFDASALGGGGGGGGHGANSAFSQLPPHYQLYLSSLLALNPFSSPFHGSSRLLPRSPAADIPSPLSSPSSSFHDAASHHHSTSAAAEDLAMAQRLHAAMYGAGMGLGMADEGSRLLREASSASPGFSPLDSSSNHHLLASQVSSLWAQHVHQLLQQKQQQQQHHHLAMHTPRSPLLSPQLPTAACSSPDADLERCTASSPAGHNTRSSPKSLETWSASPPLGNSATERLRRSRDQSPPPPPHQSDGRRDSVQSRHSPQPAVTSSDQHSPLVDRRLPPHHHATMSRSERYSPYSKRPSSSSPGWDDRDAKTTAWKSPSLSAVEQEMHPILALASKLTARRHLGFASAADKGQVQGQASNELRNIEKMVSDVESQQHDLRIRSGPIANALK